jgi:hypothetical protein
VALRDEEITVNRTTVRRRKGIAVLAAAVVTAGLSACTAGVAHDDEAGTPTTALGKGDCIEEIASSGKVYGVGLVDCTTPHAAQVSRTFTADGEIWPGEYSLQTSALIGCPLALAYAIGEVESPLDTSFLIPEEDDWDAGDHRIVCLVEAEDGGTLSESVVS